MHRDHPDQLATPRSTTRYADRVIRAPRGA